MLIQLGHTILEWAKKSGSRGLAKISQGDPLIEGGQSIDKWTPFANRDEALPLPEFYSAS